MIALRSFITVAGLAASCILLANTAGAQQTYPNRPIRVITPYATGGATTILARIIGQKLTESRGQQVIVDNRPGGNTIIGTDAVAKSKPDGYTIILTPNTHLIVPLLQPTPYDPIKDFAPVATIAVTEQLLVLHNAIPATTLQEFIALAKSKPGQLNYSTGGTGTATHLAGELFNMLTGVKLIHIPYKGAGPAVIDLIGGQVQLSFQSSPNVVAQIKAGQMKAVAISGKARSPSLPQVPTFAEAGLRGFEVGFWYGILAPAGTPMEIVKDLSGEVARILEQADMKERLISQGLESLISTPEQFAAIMKADLANFAKIIKTANIKLEN